MNQEDRSVVHKHFYLFILGMNNMLVEVENVNSMTSGGGGATSRSQTQTSELREATRKLF